MVQKYLKAFYWLKPKFILCLHCSLETCLPSVSRLIPGYNPDFVSPHTFQTWAQ